MSALDELKSKNRKDLTWLEFVILGYEDDDEIESASNYAAAELTALRAELDTRREINKRDGELIAALMKELRLDLSGVDTQEILLAVNRLRAEYAELFKIAVLAFRVAIYHNSSENSPEKELDRACARLSDILWNKVDAALAETETK